jgi:hypothetical protein
MFRLLYYVVLYLFFSCTYANFVKKCRMFRDELERQGVPNIQRTIQRGFQSLGLFSADSDIRVFQVADHEVEEC